MTEKRFRVQEHCLRSSYGIEAENWLVTNDNHIVVLNNKAEAHMVANMGNDIIDVLNEQHETISELSSQRDYLLNENKHMKELVNEKERLVKMLDNVANYMQREHREIPLDDFVEWWNNIATEGLE